MLFATEGFSVMTSLMLLILSISFLLSDSIHIVEILIWKLALFVTVVHFVRLLVFGDVFRFIFILVVAEVEIIHVHRSLAA